MSLIQLGKEYTNDVREDITLGNILPQIGTKLTYIDGTVPGVNIYPGTTWILTATTTISPNTFKEYCRIA
jgi:hypothetical protein